MAKMGDSPRGHIPVGSIVLVLSGMSAMGVATVGYFRELGQESTTFIFLFGCLLVVLGTFFNRIEGAFELGKDGLKTNVAKIRRAEKQLDQGSYIDADVVRDRVREIQDAASTGDQVRIEQPTDSQPTTLGEEPAVRVIERWIEKPTIIEKVSDTYKFVEKPVERVVERVVENVMERVVTTVVEPSTDGPVDQEWAELETINLEDVRGSDLLAEVDSGDPPRNPQRRVVVVTDDVVLDMAKLSGHELLNVEAEIESLTTSTFKSPPDPRAIRAGDFGRSYHVRKVPGTDIEIWYRPADPDVPDGDLAVGFLQRRA